MSKMSEEDFSNKGIYTLVKDLQKDMAVEFVSIGARLDRLELLDAEQNKLLEEHSKRSDELARDNDLRERHLREELRKVESRVDRLEVPEKVLKALKKILLWVGGACAAVLSILKLLKKI